MPEMAVASGHASSVKTVAVQTFHGVNPSLEECCIARNSVTDFSVYF